MINMDNEKINEFVKSYVREVQKLHQCATRFADSNKKLEGWNSPAKKRLEEKMMASVPAFDELIEVVYSYAAVANNSNREMLEADNSLLRKLG